MTVVFIRFVSCL